MNDRLSRSNRDGDADSVEGKLLPNYQPTNFKAAVFLGAKANIIIDLCRASSLATICIKARLPSVASYEVDCDRT